MNEYRKISNIFKFDEKHRTMLGINEPFETLKDLKWQGTEKVDGTNIRIHWDGHSIEFGGRTEKAEIPSHLKEYLETTFLTKEMEYVFEQMFENKDVIIFGEGYGRKIQKNGELYSETPKFIIFDIDINGFHLKRENVVDIANKLGISVVPLVFCGTLDNAIEMVKQHPMSMINANHEMEGIVLELPLDVFDKNGQRIKCKCKYEDVGKG